MDDKCFSAPRPTWPLQQVVSLGALMPLRLFPPLSACATTAAFLLLTSSSLSVEQLSCRLAADYPTPHLCSLSDASPLSQTRNNVQTHAGVFLHFRVMARSPCSVTSEGRGCPPCTTITPWIAPQGGTSNSQQQRFCALVHHQITTNTESAQQECNCSFKAV